jgi:HlyD family secretion protein
MDDLQRDDVAKTLGIDESSRRRGFAWRWIAAATVVLAAVVSGWYAFLALTDGGATRYATVGVERGDLEVTVTATGTLEPLNDVDISSELSGIVRKVLVDYNDSVRAGQVLAELDTDKLKADVAHERATLASSKARVKEAEASAAQAQLDFERYRRLASTKTASEQKYEEAKATYERGVAAVESAEADVAVAQANLELKETDLRKASICSPIDGIVLLRNVDPGQTVAATLQAPVLFRLAENLTAMELQVDVDEADVGLVDNGQTAQFAVDAYPDRAFSGIVTKVRYAPKTTEGVVTYTTHLSVDNSNLLLRPGMTATAEISVKTVKDAVLIRNEALRFAPPETQAEEQDGGLLSKILPRPPAITKPQAKNEAGTGNQRQIWILKDGEPTAVSISIGLSDGQKTEVVAGGLEPGQQVIVDVLDEGT